MGKIKFTNLSRSRMELWEEKWQTEIMERVSEEYSEEAIECSKEIEKAFESMRDKIAEGCFATAFEGVLQNIPRYCWIKNITDYAGNEYDAEIDLALHTVRFDKID